VSGFGKVLILFRSERLSFAQFGRPVDCRLTTTTIEGGHSRTAAFRPRPDASLHEDALGPHATSGFAACPWRSTEDDQAGIRGTSGPSSVPNDFTGRGTGESGGTLSARPRHSPHRAQLLL
jgi:hypothetical protein